MCSFPAAFHVVESLQNNGFLQDLVVWDVLSTAVWYVVACLQHTLLCRNLWYCVVICSWALLLPACRLHFQ